MIPIALSCSVCAHEDRDAIDAELVRGVSLRAIASAHPPLTHHAIGRHKRAHLSPALIAAHERRVERNAGSLLDRVEDLISRAERLLRAAERDGRASTALSAVRELRSLLELWGKATGELDDRPQITVNLLASPEWLSVRDAVFGALTAYPDARQRSWRGAYWRLRRRRERPCRRPRSCP